MAAFSYALNKRSNLVILVTLVFLTVVTVVAAGVNFGSPAINVVVALSIASVKATLVALFFMHLRHESPINAFIFVTGILMLALFLSFCLIDVETRVPYRPANLQPPPGGPAAAAAAAIEAAPPAPEPETEPGPPIVTR